MFVAPRLIQAYGWEMVPKVYAVALLVTGIVFWLVAAPDPVRVEREGRHCASNWRC